MLLNIALCILLAFIVFQDLKYRAIHIYLLLGIFVISGCIMWLDQKSVLTLINISIYISVVIVLLWVYISIKQKRIINPFSENIGLGDVLFFFVVAPLFSFHNYILFFITGMIFTIIASVFFKRKWNSKLIPLAGILSGYIIILKITSIFTPLDIFYSPIFNLI